MNDNASTKPSFDFKWSSNLLNPSPTVDLISQVAIGGFIVGHACLPNQWWHLGWLFLAGLPSIIGSIQKSKEDRKSTDVAWLILSLFLVWMTLRSCASGFEFSAEVSLGLLGVALLSLFCTLLWRQASNHQAIRTIGWIMGATSSFAAIVSILFAPSGIAGLFLGERLKNLLVHGGLNPVCTGLIFGFAALWIATLVERLSNQKHIAFAWAQVTLLHYATFLSGSRGAMLALACGHLAFFLFRGLRQAAPATTIFLATGLIYFAGPLISFDSLSPSISKVANSNLVQPLQNVIARADNGRFEIYQAGWTSIENLWIGTGQWGVKENWQSELQPFAHGMMTHLHSAFFATFVHGGIVASVLMLILLSIGFQRASKLAHQGDATWITLLTFGCAGLLFDGESLTSLTTAPRFEGLLFWLPLIVALSLGSPKSSTERLPQ